VKINKCLNCGSDDIFEFSDYAQCQRCHSKIDSEGGVTYEPDNIQDNIDRYDDLNERYDE
jgi:hypothetical protein